MKQTLETTGQEVTSPEVKRAGRLKRMIDFIISRARRTEVMDDDAIVAQVLENIREEMETPQNVKFSDLEELALLARHHPDEVPSITPVLTDTAELLFEDILASKKQAKKCDVNLNQVWSAMKAWDAVRNPTTSKLCVQVLNSFHADGQAHLAKAWIEARDTGKPFEEALDEVNLAAA